MVTYTPMMVERYLRNYLDIRLSLDLQGTDYRVAAPTQVAVVVRKNVPLGQTKANPRWPFMDKQHAPRVRDGKQQSRQREEFHCAILDVEIAMKKISDDDYWIIYNHLIMGTQSLDDLVKMFHFKGRSGARMRVMRAVNRLTREMEHR